MNVAIGIPHVYLILLPIFLPFVAAFTADSETTLQVVAGRDTIVESWTGEKGVTGLQEIPGVAGYSTDELDLVAVMSEGSYIGITEVSAVCQPLLHTFRFP